MSTDPLDSLVERLSTGDAEAIEQAFQAHEQYLRMIVRRQLSRCLRAKFDSIDIVHSVWVRLLPGFREGRWRFGNARELRAFLVKATRNHLINRVQHVSLEVRCERGLTPARRFHFSKQPPPDDGLVAEELWQQLVVRCPPVHRELLRLKRQGASLDQIAARTGLHKSSVRRILYDLVRRFMVGQRGTAPVVEST
jgi:DNA-directed RNA polymerase specialized sigma24 family protein